MAIPDERLAQNVAQLVENIRRGNHQTLLFHLTPDLNGQLTSQIVRLVQQTLPTLTVIPVAFNASYEEFLAFPFKPIHVPFGWTMGSWSEQLSKITKINIWLTPDKAHAIEAGLENILLNQCAQLQDAYYLPAFQFSFTDEEKEQKWREWATYSV